MTEYLVRINDYKNNNNYTRLVDCIRPQDDNQCAYIRITKFQALVLFTAVIPNNIILCIDSAQNSYTNDPASSIAVNSPIIDSFAPINFTTLAGGSIRAIYNVENNIVNWIKINRSSLSNLKFSFKTCNQYLLSLAGLNDNISYEFLPDFPFTLQFKIKFE